MRLRRGRSRSNTKSFARMSRRGRCRREGRAPPRHACPVQAQHGTYFSNACTWPKPLGQRTSPVDAARARSYNCCSSATTRDHVVGGSRATGLGNTFGPVTRRPSRAPSFTPTNERDKQITAHHRVNAYYHTPINISHIIQPTGLHAGTKNSTTHRTSLAPLCSSRKNSLDDAPKKIIITMTINMGLRPLGNFVPPATRETRGK